MRGLPDPADPALLVFCDETDLFWLWPLRRGFRHVFVALPVDGGWITIDPLSTRMEVAFHPMPAGSDLAGWFRARGHVVLCVPRCRPGRSAPPFLPFTCVTVAKRLLGLTAPLILTPWQLYRHFAPPPLDPCHREQPIMSRRTASPKPRAAPVAATNALPVASVPAAPVPALPPAPANDGLAPGERSLLRRAAGRAGTVLTGWRGVLAPGALAPTRKRLLGE